ncbi:MAG: hypothetical protein ACP5U1_16975, partial [Desulfomonilaceae bacterium]
CLYRILSHCLFLDYYEVAVIFETSSSQRELSVPERYGIVSNEELVEEIDRLTFDHGETKLWVEKRDRALTKCKQTVQKQEMLRVASKH